MVLRPLTALQSACQGPARAPRPSTATALTPAGADRLVRREAAAHRSEEPAGKPYRSAAILAKAAGAHSRPLGPAPAPPSAQWRLARAVAPGWHTGCGVVDADFRKPACNFRRTSRKRPSRSPRPSRTSAPRWRNPIVPTPDHLRGGQNDDVALVRSVLVQR